MKHFTIKAIIFICLLVVTILINPVQAQVTIGSNNPPAKAAILEIKSQESDVNNVTSNTGGLGLSRVLLENKYNLYPFIKVGDPEWSTTAKQEATKKEHVGLMVYNLTSNLATETRPEFRFRRGIYVWDGTQWNFVYEGFGQRYFFIPSFNISFAGKQAGDLGTPVDLYGEYKKQFTRSGNATFISSNASLTRVPSPGFDRLYEPNELDYVITYYDTNVMQNVTISATGVLNYRFKSVNTTSASFINVVFIIKEDKL